MRNLQKIFSCALAFFLLFGLFFAPSQAKASFWTSLFGVDVSADVPTDDSVSDVDKNSQNSDLALQVVSSTQTSQDDTSKDNNTSDDASLNSDVTINIASGDAFIPAVNHIGVDGTTSDDSTSDQTSIYVIRAGDSITQIADMFGVSVNTIYWANDLKKGDKLKEGDTLVILPISGIEHTIKKGETLKGIAKLYSADVGDIAQYNGITQDSPLAVGDKIIVPNAEMYITDKTTSKSKSTNSNKNQNIFKDNPVFKSIADYFINPLSDECYKSGRCHKTQGLHDHYAIDIGAPIGTPIHAAASGTVVFARTGSNGGYGNLVIIKHPNGTETRYAHQSKIATHSGEQVSQGEVIGYVGSTGHSTGPHLHFEDRGSENPGVDWSWKPWNY